MNKQITKRMIAGILLLILAIFLYYNLNYSSFSTTNSGIEEKILTKFNLSRNDTQITRLTDLESLKQKYPVIYGEAKEGDYEIKTQDKLIIYDYENDKIIKEFDLSYITVG
jgi:hypothetical protein